MTLLCLIAAAIAGDNAHSVDVYAGTEFPLMVGVGATYEHPTRLRLDVNGGFMPDAYVDALNWILTTFDVYDETTADLIDDVLTNALLGRAELGFRPWEERGWTAALGYQHLRVFGSTAGLTSFVDGVDEDALETAQEFTGNLTIDIAVHQIHGELGYERALMADRFGDHLRIRGTVGFAYTLRANTTADTTQEPSNPIHETAADIVIYEAEVYLDDVFEEWVHIPTLGVSAGYRF